MSNMNEKPSGTLNENPDANAGGPAALEAQENDAGRRLDRILRKHFPAFPLSFINRLLREKKVRVNGKAQNGAYRVMPGDLITGPQALSVGRAAQEEASSLQNRGPQALPLSHATLEKAFPPQNGEAAARAPQRESEGLHGKWRIVYEDDDLLVVDKPKGLLTHGLLTHGKDDGQESLASYVSAYLAGRIPASLSFRPGPLHRLDRNTSGLVVFGKSLKGARFFTEATRRGLVKKYYLALVSGIVEKEEAWEDYLFRDKKKKKTRAASGDACPDNPAKRAVTRIRPLEAGDGETFVEAEISSGKTHQIRAQCALHGHPLCGDQKYGGTPRHGGYFLRAHRIVIETALSQGTAGCADGDEYGKEKGFPVRHCPPNHQTLALDSGFVTFTSSPDGSIT